MSIDEVIRQEIIIEYHVLCLSLIVIPVYPTLILTERILEILKLQTVFIKYVWNYLLVDEPFLMFVYLTWISQHQWAEKNSFV